MSMRPGCLVSRFRCKQSVRATSDYHLRSQQLLQQNSSLHSNSFLKESHRSGGAILSRQKRQSKPAARQPSMSHWWSTKTTYSSLSEEVLSHSKLRLAQITTIWKMRQSKNRKPLIVPLMLKGVMSWHIRIPGLPGTSPDQTRILYWRAIKNGLEGHIPDWRSTWALSPSLKKFLIPTGALTLMRPRKHWMRLRTWNTRRPLLLTLHFHVLAIVHQSLLDCRRPSRGCWWRAEFFVATDFL